MPEPIRRAAYTPRLLFHRHSEVQHLLVVIE